LQERISEGITEKRHIIVRIEEATKKLMEYEDMVLSAIVTQSYVGGGRFTFVKR